MRIPKAHFQTWAHDFKERGMVSRSEISPEETPGRAIAGRIYVMLIAADNFVGGMSDGANSKYGGMLDQSFAGEGLACHKDGEVAVSRKGDIGAMLRL